MYTSELIWRLKAVQGSPRLHTYSVIMLDTSQTSAKVVHRKRSEITVTSQIHGHPYYYCTSTTTVLANTQLPFPPRTHTRTNTHKHTCMHTLTVLHFVQNWSNKIPVWLIADFVSGICQSYPVKYWKLPVNNVNPLTMCTKVTNHWPFPRLKLVQKVQQFRRYLPDTWVHGRMDRVFPVYPGPT